MVALHVSPNTTTTGTSSFNCNDRDLSFLQLKVLGFIVVSENNDLWCSKGLSAAGAVHRSF